MLTCLNEWSPIVITHVVRGQYTLKPPPKIQTLRGKSVWWKVFIMTESMSVKNVLFTSIYQNLMYVFTSKKNPALSVKVSMMSETALLRKKKIKNDEDSTQILLRWLGLDLEMRAVMDEDEKSWMRKHLKQTECNCTQLLISMKIQFILIIHIDYYSNGLKYFREKI